MADDLTRYLDEQNFLMSGRCSITSQWYTVMVPREQYAAWCGGECIQTAMPQLSAEQREFIMTHTTPAEWEWIFGKEGEPCGRQGN